MTHHYPVLLIGWKFVLRPIRTTTYIQVVTHHQCRISVFIPWTSFSGDTSSAVLKAVFSQARIFVLISDNPPRLAMLTAGCHCLKYCCFKTNKMLLLLLLIWIIFCQVPSYGHLFWPNKHLMIRIVIIKRTSPNLHIYSDEVNFSE